MNISNPKTYVLFLLVSILFISTPAIVDGQVAGDLVIAEVASDPASGAGLGEPANEFFVICNRTGTGFNLNGWTVTDNSAGTLTLPNFNLAGRSCAVVANAGIDLGATGYNCSPAPINVIFASSWFNGLSNSGDELILSTPAALVVDAMSYGTNVNQLNPSAPDVFNNSGASLIRTGYPGNPASLPDTDTNSDWTSRAGSPCDAAGPSAAFGIIGGRAVTSTGRGISFVAVMLTGGGLMEPIYATTNTFGYYRFEDLPVGESYVLQAISQRYVFKTSSILVNLNDQIFDADFIGAEGGSGTPKKGKGNHVKRLESDAVLPGIR